MSKYLGEGDRNGREERIRTSGPYVPNVVLYQAELLPDTSRSVYYNAHRTFANAEKG